MTAIMRYFVWLILVLFTSCDNEPVDVQGEYVFRLDGEKRLPDLALKDSPSPTYPWNSQIKGSIQPITKEYFRCRGSSLHPPIIVHAKEKSEDRISDCGGSDKHSLPYRGKEEFVYPILIELLNHIQEVTKKQVIITSGHRCPDHNRYSDQSTQNSGSKHMIGAACDFYIKGLESHPEAACKIIEDFYKKNARYQKTDEWQKLRRFEKAQGVSIQPWYNKEIMIKIYKANEGRNFDNRHSYPYICLQVRFDRTLNLPVNLTWDQAQRYLRR